MTQNKPNLKKLSILLAIILLAVLIPLHQSYADVAGIPTSPADLVTGALQKVNEIMLEGVGTILKWAALTLEAVVKPETQAVIINTFVVQESWKIIRDFVNMFFILFLIIMAFGTIFDIKNYTWRDILPKFLIAALLINFSLVIGQYIIGIGNGLAAIFLRQIAGFSNDMATGFDIQKAIPGKEFATQGLAMIANDSARVIFTGIFSLVFLIVALFAFLAALLFTIIRIPILWLLLIVSPIAWIGYVLPNIRAQTWSKWWNTLISWVFFLPVYLFFLMFAVMFIRRKNELAALPPSQGTALFTGPGGALSDLLFYVLTILFMVFGLKAAFSVGSFAANGAGKLMGGIEKRVKKYFPGAAYVRGGVAGLKARGEEIKEKGILGISGAQRAREAEIRAKGWIAGIPGLGRAPGAREATERARLEEINKETEKLKAELLRIPAEQRRQFLLEARSRRGVAGEAAMFEYAKQGYSTLGDYKETMKKFGGEHTALGRQYLENLKQAKFSDLFQSPDQELRIARGQVEDTRDLVNLRRELYKDLAKRNQISDVAAYKEAKQLLSSIPAELKSFLDSIRPEYVVGTREARQDAIKNRTLGDPDLERKLVEFMKDKKEIDDVQLRQEALAVVGGKNTIEGRNVINEINKFNPVINIEADLREEKGIPVDQPLSAEDKNRIVGEIADEIAKKEFADLRKMSGKFWEDEKTQQAVRQTFDRDELSQLLENAPKEMRRALKNLSKGGSTTAGG